MGAGKVLYRNLWMMTPKPLRLDLSTNHGAADHRQRGTAEGLQSRGRPGKKKKAPITRSTLGTPRRAQRFTQAHDKVRRPLVALTFDFEPPRVTLRAPRPRWKHVSAPETSDVAPPYFLAQHFSVLSSPPRGAHRCYSRHQTRARRFHSFRPVVAITLREYMQDVKDPGGELYALPLSSCTELR